MDSEIGYKVRYEKKKDIIYSRMDAVMIKRLRDLSNQTGISVSEIVRDSVRRLFSEISTTGSYSIKIN